VLRFAELELFGRLVALENPRLPHPGLPALLLSPFLALGTDDPPPGPPTPNRPPPPDAPDRNCTYHHRPHADVNWPGPVA
jgi:hypothetical protein